MRRKFQVLLITLFIFISSSLSVYACGNSFSAEVSIDNPSIEKVSIMVCKDKFCSDFEALKLEEEEVWLDCSTKTVCKVVFDYTGDDLELWDSTCNGMSTRTVRLKAYYEESDAKVSNTIDIHSEYFLKADLVDNGNELIAKESNYSTNVSVTTTHLIHYILILLLIISIVPVVLRYLKRVDEKGILKIVTTDIIGNIVFVSFLLLVAKYTSYDYGINQLFDTVYEYYLVFLNANVAIFIIVGFVIFCIRTASRIYLYCKRFGYTLKIAAIVFIIEIILFGIFLLLVNFNWYKVYA